MHLDEPVVIAWTQNGRIECLGRKERQNSAKDNSICKIGRRLHVLARGKALNLIDIKKEIAPLYAIPSAAGQSRPCVAASEKMAGSLARRRLSLSSATVARTSSTLSYTSESVDGPRAVAAVALTI